MPCSSCGQSRPIQQVAVAPAADRNISAPMLYQTELQTIRATDGTSASLLGSLVKSPSRPTNGWAARLLINGIPNVISGNSAVEAYNMASTLLRSNGIQMTAASVWTNLNMQWLQNVRPAARRVEVADLLAVCMEYGTLKNPGKKEYGPSSWGSIAWEWLNLFLSRTDFKFYDFVLQLKYVLDMLNPNTNPHLGCNECWGKFGAEVRKIEDLGTMTRDDARLWLVGFHNSVNARLGKPQLSLEQVGADYFWT